MKSKRASTEMPSEDVPLVQEITFIKNKENIKNHIETLKTKEEETFKLLKVCFFFNRNFYYKLIFYLFIFNL